MKESDLFPPLKLWLEERSYEVFTEVQSKLTGGRADIVAVSGPVVTVVEMKLTLSMDLIAQAISWKPFANYVYIAIPKSKYPRKQGYADIFLGREGIGMIELEPFENWIEDENDRFVRFEDYRIRLKQNPKFNRRIDDHIRKSLVPQHKDLLGGHSGGGYFTPYKLTILRVQEYLNSWNVRHNNNDRWVTIKDILDHCETHYSSPKPSLSSALRSFELDWCEMKVEGGKLHYRMKEAIE